MKRFNLADLFLVLIVFSITQIVRGLSAVHASGWNTELTVLLIASVFATALLAYWWHEAKKAAQPEERKAADKLGCVDIWAMQRHLMAASDQKLPYLPEINKGALMYYALILEEASELGEALVAILATSVCGNDALALRDAAISIEQAQKNMGYQSKKIRKLLESVSDHWSTVPPLPMFKEIIDGAADVAVVTAGFSLAAGVPGREAFVEANRGNTSKANPATGKIDKTPDGKWIKGVKYVAPNMMAVLEEHVRRHREVMDQPTPFMG